MSSATIKDARIAAAHEGIAELIVLIAYENGGTSEIALDEMATRALMQSCEAETIDEIKGKPWEHVRDALQVSYNRYR